MKKKNDINWERIRATALGVFVWACTAAMIMLAMTGCTTVRESENYVDKHHFESMMERMDSLFKRQTTVIRDSSWRETFIRELQRIQEKSDTSHTMVVDTAGNVIKETIIINNTKEVTSEKEHQELLCLRHSMERMDSTMQVMRQQLVESDSILQAMDRQTTVTKPVPWYRQLWNNLHYIVIGLIVGAVLMLTKGFWTGLLKKIL